MSRATAAMLAGISVSSGSMVRFAKVTYHGSREGAVHGNFAQLRINKQIYIYTLIFHRFCVLSLSSWDHKITTHSCVLSWWARSLQGKLQLIVNDTDAVSATLDVPYKANVAQPRSVHWTFCPIHVLICRRPRVDQRKPLRSLALRFSVASIVVDCDWGFIWFPWNLGCAECWLHCSSKIHSILTL